MRCGMRKYLIIFMIGFLFIGNLYLQEVQTEIVVDLDEDYERLKTEKAKNDFNDYFSNYYSEGVWGYILHTSDEQILEDACEWKGCKKPFFSQAKTDLIREFKNWLSQHYEEWFYKKYIQEE